MGKKKRKAAKARSVARPEQPTQPECEVCGEPFPQARADLGYKTCLEHGAPRKDYLFGIPYNKGPYQLVSPDDVEDMV